MKRLTVALLVLLAPGVAFAFDASRHPARIGVLRPLAQYDRGRESSIQDLVLRSLRSELRERGYDAFDAQMTYEEAERRDAGTADYLVEVVGGDAYSDDYGGIGIGGRNAEVTIAVIASRVAGQLRIYDARTMELLANKSISRRSSAVLPTSIGLGGREFYAVVALPFVQWAQFRRVAHAAAHDAAEIVTTTLQGQ
jgi:hypothetical protein